MLKYLSSPKKKLFSSRNTTIYRQEDSIFFCLVCHDTAYSRSIFEHDVQPRGKTHITLNMDVEVNRRESSVCGEVSQFNNKQRKVQRDLENNGFCVFC